MLIKTLFVSDIHLGSRHSSVKEFLEFLSLVKENPPERIYIIGDFIDGWKLKRNWHWTDDNNKVIRKLLGFLRRGTEIYYIAGNHDEFMRDFLDDFSLFDMGSIHLGNEFVYETVKGQKLLVIHGDYFDLISKYAKWVSKLGDIGYETFLRLNSVFQYFRKHLGFRHWSLSKAVKTNVKKAVNFISNFEECLVKYSKEKGCDGCVCGHIHTPDYKVLPNGFIYANSGDWVESCTAFYEDFSGEFHIYRHPLV
jgi:UDP-2,3-diacylglucosamine pyrophosphatase LpxH